MQHFSGVGGDLLAWAAALAGLASLACIIGLIDRRRRRPPQASPEVTRLDRGREWDLVMRQATRDLSRGAAVAALQADSAVKIEAAEHAYNRLVADCAGFCQATSAPANDPVSLPLSIEPETPTSEPEETPERTPLAA